MKRSVALAPLSRDHHEALFAALTLKRATKPADGERFLEFWRAHGRRHFQVEEEVLLPGWSDLAGDPDPQPVARVATEHLAIRVGARRAAAGALGAEELVALGELLERHVRFEERELFPLIEGSLAAEPLAALGAEVERAERQG